MTKMELRKRIDALSLTVYEATILLGFSHPNRIYSDKTVSNKTAFALERLELLAKAGKLEREKKRNREKILEITKGVRAQALRTYHLRIDRKKVEKSEESS